MNRYSIPAMSASMEFSSLDYLAKYINHLVKTTGDNDYSVVYEWGDHGPGPYPPLAVLYLIEGEWVRREVLVTIVQKKDGSCEYKWSVEGSVNGH